MTKEIPKTSSEEAIVRPQPPPTALKPTEGLSDRRICYQWRNKPERCVIGGKDYTYKSQIERKWAEYLQILKDLGAIIEWLYEPPRFEHKERYRHKRVYTLDFKVTEEDELQKIVTVYHEVKTKLQQTDIRRFRYMNMDYEDVRMVLVLPYCSRNSNQARLRGNALKYCERIIYCNPLFKQWSIR